MTLKEKEGLVVAWWNSRAKNKVQLVDDKYSTYDAEGPNALVEIKHRHTSYDTKLIEVLKMAANYQRAELKNKTFYYVVSDANGISVFNITKHIKEIAGLPTELILMEWSHFHPAKIKKLVQFLPAGLAVVWEQKQTIIL